jgi:hypothetical protein
MFVACSGLAQAIVNKLEEVGILKLGELADEFVRDLDFLIKLGNMGPKRQAEAKSLLINKLLLLNGAA